MPVPDIESLGELHQATRLALDKRIATLMERECEAAMESAMEDRKALDRAEQLYRDWLDANRVRSGQVFDAADADHGHRPRSKARIGPQRFHMLKTLLDRGPKTAEEVSEITG